MSVEDLVVRLGIEEDNKLAQKNTYTPDYAKANMVEHAGSSSKSNSKAKGKGKGKSDKKGKGKAEFLALKAGIMKQKFQVTCYNCDQPGHRAANYKMSSRWNPTSVAVDYGGEAVCTRAICIDDIHYGRRCLMGCYGGVWGGPICMSALLVLHWADCALCFWIMTFENGAQVGHMFLYVLRDSARNLVVRLVLNSLGFRLALLS
ncbi:putative retrotransposon protein [Tanacetum coccineum]